ncbi:MAG TPA: hypothetical protein VM008_21445 [Phycisphaerae bacterium]|nr:hypothetical protein [Phycisphaerae bacterium]
MRTRHLTTVLLLLSIPLMGCVTKRTEDFDQRVKNTVSFLSAPTKIRFDQLVHRRLLDDIRTMPLHVDMAPILSAAILEKHGEVSKIWVFWLEDQPSVTSIRVRYGSRSQTAPIPNDYVQYNKATAVEFANSGGAVAVNTNSEIGRLIALAPDPSRIEITVFSPRFGHSRAVPLIPAPEENATTKPSPSATITSHPG